jgi:methylmalonyl-CoA carboxyltransferase large subunit
MAQAAETIDLVQALSAKIKGLELQVKRLQVKAQDVPEDHLVAIAAAVAAYLGEKGKARQPRFPASPVWAGNTRRAQHAHHPLYTR